jgi:phosphatidylglycerophosphatase A
VLLQQGKMVPLTGGRDRGTVRCVRKTIIEALATGFYVGKIPVMPGTWGTLVGLPLAWILTVATRENPVIYMATVGVFILVASWVAELYERSKAAHDPSEIVIDEIAGILVAMTWLPLTWQAFVAGFILFRFFDILKPFPIGAIDRRIQGGFGTVLDDVAAGLAANVVLQIIYAQTLWLGVRLDGF